jgi:hypothetical protein
MLLLQFRRQLRLAKKAKQKKAFGKKTSGMARKL